MTPAPRLLSDIPTAAEQLSVSTRMLDRLIAEGTIETVKVGRLRRVPADALADYIERLRRAS